VGPCGRRIPPRGGSMGGLKMAGGPVEARWVRYCTVGCWRLWMDGLMEVGC
jgi:hypothetical protein